MLRESSGWISVVIQWKIVTLRGSMTNLLRSNSFRFKRFYSCRGLSQTLQGSLWRSGLVHEPERLQRRLDAHPFWMDAIRTEMTSILTAFKSCFTKNWYFCLWKIMFIINTFSSRVFTSNPAFFSSLYPPRIFFIQVALKCLVLCLLPIRSGMVLLSTFSYFLHHCIWICFDTVLILCTALHFVRWKFSLQFVRIHSEATPDLHFGHVDGWGNG